MINRIVQKTRLQRAVRKLRPRGQSDVSLEDKTSQLVFFPKETSLVLLNQTIAP
jgi:hypothetical protein